MRLLLLLLVILIIVPFAHSVGVGCNGKCDIASDCGTNCEQECTSKGYMCCGPTAYLPADYKCCSGQLVVGTCCSDSDCADGTCQNHDCVAVISEPDKPLCGDNVCDIGENCANCAQDCLLSDEVCCSQVPHEGNCCSASDCLSHTCNNYVCQPLATCSDSVKNQDESDIDCGGICNKCANAKVCSQNSDCLSDYCNGGRCAEKPVCNEGEKRSCNASNSCPGNLTCTNNAWTECSTSMNYCDSNCDGTNDMCTAQSCQACACIQASDCAENVCMNVACGGAPKSCTYTNITSCLNDDGCCPPGCTWQNDNDCNQTDSCSNNTECLDNDMCTIDVCEGSPKACVHHSVSECVSGDGCCPANCTFVSDMDCSCTPNWVCQDWSPSECPREKRQKRDCNDANNCANRTNIETRLCTFASKNPMAGKSTSSSTKMLTRNSVGNNTNSTVVQQSIAIQTKINQNRMWILLLMVIVGIGIVILMYHEGLLKNLITMKSREEVRKANMQKRIKLFCRQRQSFIMIKTNLIAEGYTLEEINRGIEEYEHEAAK